MRNFKYELHQERINSTKYLIFDRYIVTIEGRIFGVTPRKEKVGNKLVFNHKRKMYFLGKVILQLFGKKDAVKDFTHKDGNKNNCSYNNLVWGVGYVRDSYPDQLSYKGTAFYHVSTFPGYYVDVDGRILSNRYYRNPLYLMKQRELAGHPCIGLQSKESPYKTLYTHLLMIDAFYGIPYGTTKCIWKDGNRSNCRIENLRPATISQVMSNHFIEGRRDPNMFKKHLDRIYGKGKRPWTSKHKAS